jgi:Excalibur calcium-binding domain
VIFPSSLAWPIMRSTRTHRLAMSHNRGLDRDKDGIACEKA